MRYGILSDIHGNLPALTTAIERLSAEGVDRWLCAGDIVGYGPQPNECVTTLAALKPICVVGNHELVALGELPEDRCGRRARDSLRWTRSMLTENSRRYLASLPRTAHTAQVVISHGSLDNAEEYVRAPEQAESQLARLAADFPNARILILGHTHRPWLYQRMTGSIRITGTSISLLNEHRYLVNPGSVGQSRQFEVRPLARFALLDLPENGQASVRFFAVPYDHQAVRAALRQAGLPTDNMHIRPRLRGLARRPVRALMRQLSSSRGIKS